MKKIKRIMTIILMIIFTLAFIISVVACVDMKMDRWGGGDSRSARDFFMALVAMSIFFLIPTALLWVKVFKSR